MYNEKCPPNSTRHVVKKGDTLWKLSQAYGASVQSMIDANPGINTNNLQIGSILCIPSIPTYPHICSGSTFSYIVHSGDTLWKLSKAFGISVQSMIDANPGINTDNLQIGSTLCIPLAPSVPTPLKPTAPPAKTAPSLPVICPKGSFSYMIQAGDTLWKLSQAYGVSVQSILDLNPSINPQNLQIGSTLCIPLAPTVPTPLKPIAPQTKTAPMTMANLPATCPKGSFSYMIQAGDTLWKLSQAYGVSIQSILDLNPSINPQNLQIGSTLCIPLAPTVPTPLKPTAPPAKTVPMTTPIEPAPQRPTAPPAKTVPMTAPTEPAPQRPTAPPAKTVPMTAPIEPAPLIPAAPPTKTVPLTTMPSTRTFTHLIKKCDTICGIAKKYYVSVESIMKENPWINPRCLQVGMYINVPINCCGENTWRYTVRKGDTLNRIANKLSVCSSALIEANPNIDFNHLVHCQIICIPKD